MTATGLRVQFASVLLSALCFPGLAGCGFFFVQVGSPSGAAPPLGNPIGPSVQPSGSGNLGNGDLAGELERRSPAVNAVTADLAGVWVLADGDAAVYIDEMGNLYRLEIAAQIADVSLPPFIPRVFNHVGMIEVEVDGAVAGTFSVSLLGLAADGLMTGTLDESRNVIYDADTVIMYDLGSSPQSLRNASDWYRWDPVSATFPGLDP